MNPILLVAVKDLRQLARDPGSLFWVFLFPLVFAGFFSVIMTFAMQREQRALPIVVVDEARTRTSARLVEALRSHERLAISERSLTEARRLVQRGSHPAFVHLPAGFGSGSGPEVGLGLDPTRQVEAGVLRSVITGELLNLSGPVDEVSRAPASLASAPRIVLMPLGPLERPRSPLDLTFPAAILWGLMGCAASFAVNLVSERKRGTLIRLRSAPIGSAEILAGKALSCFLACAATSLLIVAIALALGVRPVNPAALAVGLFTVALCFVGITTALSVAGESEQSVAGAGWGTLVLMAMIGGAMVPLDVMPGWMQTLSHISPVKWGILLLEGAIWRGHSARELLMPAAALLAIGSLCFAVGVAVLARKTSHEAHG